MLDACFRSVCPIQSHRLLFISISTGPCFVRCQSSALHMVSGQCILGIRLRQLYMKVCTFLVVFLVVIHVSDPYSETDFTLELKILNLVSVAIALALHVFFLSWRKATIALPIRALTSTSVPPWLFTMLPRYVKVSTSSSTFSPSIIGPSLAVLCERKIQKQTPQRLKNNGIHSSDLLQRFFTSISINNAGRSNGKEW